MNTGSFASPVSVRPARHEDSAALAALLLQLYHTEVPGVFNGPSEAYHAFIRHVLYADPMSMRGRYVLLDAHEAVVATAAIRFPYDLSAGTMPPGTVTLACQLLGVAHAARIFGTLLRASLVPNGPTNRSCAFVHSVVVDQAHRRHGLGYTLMGAMEGQARMRGVATMQLRVVHGNVPAQRLYTELGYRVVGRSPRLLDWLARPTEVMQKQIVLG